MSDFSEFDDEEGVEEPDLMEDEAKKEEEVLFIR